MSTGYQMMAICLLGVFSCGTAAKSPPVGLQPLREMLAAPAGEIDLAQAKLTIDRMIDPKIDIAVALRQLGEMAATIQARFPPAANDAVKMELLLSSVYQSGPWNDYRPFSYDLDDPFGKEIRNKLLTTYLDTRKGNCVSMPILLVILGQKLGLNITLAAAPEHVMAKFANPVDGQWYNVEATSGGFKYDGSYIREGNITPLAVKNGIYLRPLDRRESLNIMMATLMEFYGRNTNQQALRIAVADLALSVDPKDVVAMLQKGNAYYRQLKQHCLDKYPGPSYIPADMRQQCDDYGHNNRLWFDKAEALGWRLPVQQQNNEYQGVVERAKAAHQGSK
jgi:regulator of sirC expression with transglutaminase-like and TPR domain